MADFLIRTTIKHYLSLGHAIECDQIDELQFPKEIRDLIVGYTKYNLDSYQYLYDTIPIACLDIGLSNPIYYVHLNLDKSNIVGGTVRFCDSFIAKYTTILIRLNEMTITFENYCEMIRDRNPSQMLNVLMPSDADFTTRDVDRENVKNMLYRAIFDMINSTF